MLLENLDSCLNGPPHGWYKYFGKLKVVNNSHSVVTLAWATRIINEGVNNISLFFPVTKNIHFHLAPLPFNLIRITRALVQNFIFNPIWYSVVYGAGVTYHHELWFRENGLIIFDWTIFCEKVGVWVQDCFIVLLYIFFILFLHF